MSLKSVPIWIFVVLIFGFSGCTTASVHMEPVDLSTQQSTNHDQGPVFNDFPFSPYVEVINMYTVGHESLDNAVLKEKHDLVESFTATCMKERGFTYYPTPWIPNEDSPGIFPEGDILWLPKLPNTKDEVELIGYGVKSPLPVSQISVEENRNSDYRESLSVTSQAKYDMDLIGPDPYSDPPSGASKSCRILASEKYPSLPAVDDTARDIFRTQYNDLGWEMDHLVSMYIFDDPRILSLNAEWASCMSVLDYKLTSGNMYNEEDLSPWAAWTLALRTLSNGSLGESWYNYRYEGTTPEEERSLLGTEAERKIAVDDFLCRQETDYIQRYYAIQVELETDFIDQHQKQLDEMMAFADQYR